MEISQQLAYIGLGVALLSYWAGTKGFLSFNSRWYQRAQLFSCGLAGGAAVLMHFWPYVIFNAVWALIALQKLWKLSEAEG